MARRAERPARRVRAYRLVPAAGGGGGATQAHQRERVAGVQLQGGAQIAFRLGGLAEIEAGEAEQTADIRVARVELARAREGDLRAGEVARRSGCLAFRTQGRDGGAQLSPRGRRLPPLRRAAPIGRAIDPAAGRRRRWRGPGRWPSHTGGPSSRNGRRQTPRWRGARSARRSSRRRQLVRLVSPLCPRRRNGRMRGPDARRMWRMAGGAGRGEGHAVASAEPGAAAVEKAAARAGNASGGGAGRAAYRGGGAGGGRNGDGWRGQRNGRGGGGALRPERGNDGGDGTKQGAAAHERVAHLEGGLKAL